MLKIKLIIFTIACLILKNLIQSSWKLITNHIKTLVFTTLDLSQLKKLMIMEIFIVYKWKKWINTLFLTLQMKMKSYLKKYNDVWIGIKNEIKSKNGGKENHYEQDYMEI